MCGDDLFTSFFPFVSNGTRSWLQPDETQKCQHPCRFGKCSDATATLDFYFIFFNEMVCLPFPLCFRVFLWRLLFVVRCNRQINVHRAAVSGACWKAREKVREVESSILLFHVRMFRDEAIFHVTANVSRSCRRVVASCLCIALRVACGVFDSIRFHSSRKLLTKILS